MNEEQKSKFYAVYRTLSVMQDMIQLQEIVTTSLLGVMRENPDFEKLYAKHHAAVSRGPIAQGHAAAREQVAQML